MASGAGFDGLFRAWVCRRYAVTRFWTRITIFRQLWNGGTLAGHDGPAGQYPYLHQDDTFHEEIPVMLVAIGEKTLEFAGGCMDAVVLHTFLSDEALERSVATVRRGAEHAGRDPSEVRIWSVLATVGDHIDEGLRLKKTVGRLASYLRGYGDVLVRANQWDPAVLDRFRADPFVREFKGAFDARATTGDLEYLSTILPAEWMAAAATGTGSAVHRIDSQAVRPRCGQRDPPRCDPGRTRADPCGIPCRASGGVAPQAVNPGRSGA